MKKYIILFFAGMLTLSGCAQKIKDSEVPAVVEQSFHKQFPDVKKVKWEKEGDQEYEAEFEKEGVEYSANFDSTGKWLETETEIKKGDLPPAVLAAISREFPGYEIEESERVESRKNGTAYEFELEKGESNYEILISQQGHILKKQEVKEEKED